MPAEHLAPPPNRELGEDVASWYFRLNGFLSIPGFIVHLDTPTDPPNPQGEPRHARTEADLIAVRFPYSREVIDARPMIDHEKLISPSIAGQTLRTMFVLVEVKVGRCDMNDPWTNRAAQNMQRVIRRLGITPDENEVEAISSALYDSARWEGEKSLVQYVCIGKRNNNSRNRQYSGLIQITWKDIGEFLFERFSTFPEKLPSGHVHSQWPDFGREYGRWFIQTGRDSMALNYSEAIERYIETGTLSEQLQPAG